VTSGGGATGESIGEPAPAPDEAPEAPPPIRGFRAQVAYDGARFHGWQFQPAQPTVQGEIERAIERVTAQKIRVQGAGRTDAGVHALGQVCSFLLSTRLEPTRLLPALNFHLPPDVRVLVLEPAPIDFSARFSAVWRRYRYFLARRADPFVRGRAHVPRFWPELERLRAAEEALIGEGEFRAFTTQPQGPFGCRVDEARWSAWPGGLVFTVRSNRFLYQMVRILVGTFLEIGRGRIPPEAMARILAGGDRRAAGPLAPGHGLYLMEVGYDPAWPSPSPPGSGEVPPGAWPHLRIGPPDSSPG